MIWSNNFVIKPNKWSGWRGILIVEKDEEKFKIQDTTWTEAELKLHMTDILHGSFSLHGSSDSVVIEELLSPGRDFGIYCNYGLADIRIIVYNYVPITAMIRVPTIHSWWKANLAQWGIWLGLNIANWQVISLFQDKKIHTNNFPNWWEHTKNRILPFWDDILLYSSQVQMYTKLWYLALDWVITKDWPKLLEINARAWLEIQNVNLVPLASRLKKVEDIKILSPEKWVEIAKTLFHTDILTDGSWKKILYLEQKWYFWEKEITIQVNINNEKTYISKDIINYQEISSLSIMTELNVKVEIKTFEIQDNIEWTVILWSEIVQEYLIKAKKYSKENSITKEQKWTNEIIELDNDVYRLSKRVNLSSILKPDNYFTELDEFIKNPEGYNPIFTYKFPTNEKIDSIRTWLNQVIKKIKNIQTPNIAIIELYSEKVEELGYKLSLIEAYKNEDFKKIHHFNEILFWKTDKNLLKIAKEKVGKMEKIDEKNEEALGKILSLEEIVLYIEKYFEKHNIKKIPIKIQNGNLSRMSVAYWKEVKINIAKNAWIREREMEAILWHEIGTHFQRYLSGKEQWLKLFQFWTWYYLGDEEWYAIYKSFMHLPEWYEKNAMYIKYHLLNIVDTMSFSETISILRKLYPKKKLESLFSYAVRLKRWITHSWTQWIPGTTYQKDKIYLDGYTRVKKWIDSWGQQEKLWFWKIKINDIKILENIL